eukprot:101019-Chlamydomonas_euryale.AAC.2
MNCQELATIAVEKLDVKILLINNQHLGMVMQWEDRFYKANRAHTYLGRREGEFHETNNEADIYPNFVMVRGDGAGGGGGARAHARSGAALRCDTALGEPRNGQPLNMQRSPERDDSLTCSRAHTGICTPPLCPRALK